MMISGIRTTDNFYNLNRIGSAGDVAEVKQLQAVEAIPTMEETKPSPEEIAFARRNQTQTSFDYAQNYDADKEYSVELHNSRLEDLDVEHAVSQMQKDRMLEQFRFFVGDKGSSVSKIASSEDVAARQAARPSENFNL